MDSAPPRFLLGGGIGSGKSTAAAWFAGRGARVIDTDTVARDLLQPGTAQTSAVLARWPDVEEPSGVIDRRRLGAIVFGDPVGLAELEAIVHPGVWVHVVAEAERLTDRVVIAEVPVLTHELGSGWPWIVVDAPVDLRIRRAVARGVLDEAAVGRVIDRQPTRGEWLVAATWVIDNSGDESHLDDECARVWAAAVEG